MKEDSTWTVNEASTRQHHLCRRREIDPENEGQGVGCRSRPAILPLRGPGEMVTHLLPPGSTNRYWSMTSSDAAPVVAPTATVAPVAEADRIEIVDVVRGVAVLGILLMNIPFFALPERFTEPWRADPEHELLGVRDQHDPLRRGDARALLGDLRGRNRAVHGGEGEVGAFGHGNFLSAHGVADALRPRPRAPAALVRRHPVLLRVDRDARLPSAARRAAMARAWRAAVP